MAKVNGGVLHEPNGVRPHWFSLVFDLCCQLSQEDDELSRVRNSVDTFHLQKLFVGHHGDIGEAFLLVVKRNFALVSFARPIVVVSNLIVDWELIDLHELKAHIVEGEEDLGDLELIIEVPLGSDLAIYLVGALLG